MSKSREWRVVVVCWETLEIAHSAYTIKEGISKRVEYSS